MTKEQEHWDSVIKQINPIEPHYDGWLDKYFDKLPDTELHIVELGCGWGDDTSFLSKKGYDVVSCDFSDAAINIIKNLYPTVKTSQFNLLDGLPFPTGSIQVVVADLCLHYFTAADTEMIIAEIYRPFYKVINRRKFQSYPLILYLSSITFNSARIVE